MDLQTLEISYESYLAAIVGLPLTGVTNVYHKFRPAPTFHQFGLNYQEYLRSGEMEEPGPLLFKASKSDWRKIKVDIDQVREYQANDFKIKDIAHFMGLRPCTLKREMSLHGCNMRTSYSTVTDEELDLCITVAREKFPKFGLQLIKGNLSATGMKIQDGRLRASYNRVGIKQGYPCKKKIKRRVYAVPGPLAMWHLDGFHKFDIFGFVVHGIVDGYTKGIVGMQVSDNNRSETVVRLLHAARLKWGLPACLRIDRGGENVLATDYIIQERGIHYRSVIAGKSIHNQPIERQWKDVKELCLEPLLKELHDMDFEGVLQSESHLDLFCLHFVGMDLFQRMLVDYVASWNNHPIRTKRYKTPMQLYISGLALLKERQDAGEFQVPCAELLQNENVLHLPEGIFDTEYLETIVGPFRAARDVSKYDCPLNDIELAELKELIDSTKVELGNIRKQFILAKRFVLFTINHRE